MHERFGVEHARAESLSVLGTSRLTRQPQASHISLQHLETHLTA